jgi:hypothetical protein
LEHAILPNAPALRTDGPFAGFVLLYSNGILDGHFPQLQYKRWEEAMPIKNDKGLREHVVYLLKGGGAHVPFDKVIQGLPVTMRGKRPAGAAHSPWEILEHMRLAQWDILEFSRNPKHTSPDWPSGYWPKTQAPPNRVAWSKSLKAFRADLEAMCQLLGRESTDLFKRIPHGDGQTILREALLVADHNAYHLGEVVLVRRLLGAWT